MDTVVDHRSPADGQTRTDLQPVPGGVPVLGSGTGTCRLQSLPMTDMGNAERFVLRYHQIVKYNHTAGQWLIWNSKQWRRDAKNEVVECAKSAMMTLLAEAGAIEEDFQRDAMTGFARQSQSSGKIDAMLRLAESDSRIAVEEDQLDADPYLLNLNNGVYDLRTHELKRHCSAMLLTRIAPVDYAPTISAARWNQFLRKVCADDAELMRYLQKCQGVSLVGCSDAQILVFCYGRGANGKTTYMETSRLVLGDYWQKAPLTMLLKKPSGAIPNDIARVKGARMVVASETQEGSVWDEAKVKDLTGGDRIAARFLYGEYFEFSPTHTTWVYGNHRPQVRGDDDGIWRRIKVLPFTVQIPVPEQRPLSELLQEFDGEKSGILNWMIEGYKLYQQEGLIAPPRVAAAIQSYRSDSDVVGQFLAERCEEDSDGHVTVKGLYESYAGWSMESAERRLEKRDFVARVVEKGYKKRSGAGNKTIIVGTKLKPLEYSEQQS